MRPTRNRTQLVPLAIAVAVVGAVTWLLLEGDSSLGAWLLAALILGHGLAHLAFVVPSPKAATTTADPIDWPFDVGRSWLITSFGVGPGVVRAAVRALTVVTITTALLAALATVAILVPAGWWAGLVVALAVSSTVLLALVFSPMFLIGFGIDLALLWLALISGWSPAS